MAVENGWGQGAVNNTNDYGKAKANSTNGFGKIYETSNAGLTNIIGGTGAVLSISYSSSAFCENASDPTPTVTDNVGAGTFSSTMGLVFVSTTTGQVDLSASTTGATYLITYTDTNAATATFNLTVNALDNASFSYSASSYSQADADPTPTPVLAGGTFSAGSGLVFVDSGSNTGSSTGQVDLSASTIASYTVTYTTAGTCPNTSTQTVGITSALAQVNNVYSMAFDGTNDYIDLGDSDDLSFGNGSTDSPFSISAWVNMTDATNFITIAKDATGGREYVIRTLSDDKLYFYLLDSSSNGYIGRISPAVTSNQGNWIHTVYTYNGNSSSSGIKIYLNGSSVDNVDYQGGSYTAMENTNTALNIGRQERGLNYTSGLIDEVAIFNVELTAQEVQNIYNATETGKTADLNDLTTPPVKWYRM